MPAGVRPAAFEQAPAPPALTDRPKSLAARALAGRYRLRRPLTPAGPIEVWHAVALDGGERALKLVEHDKAPPGAVAALRREHDALVQVAHPGIVRAVDWIDTGGVGVLVLEYLPGGDLVSLAGGPARTWLTAIRDVVAALGHVHRHGLVHRDVKARNVRFDRQDRATLIDFGSCEPVGSPWHAGGTTAEHRRRGWAGREHGPGDDVYAFAALCHELLHGRPPPGPGRNPVVRGSSGAEELRALVARTLAATPEDCAGNLGDFATVIEWLLAENYVR